MPMATSLSKIVLRVHQFASKNNENTEDQVTSIATNGIVMGKGFQANFKLYDDSKVDAAHGTLECTVGLGVWVYSDHSRHGSILNGDQSVHNNAVVVHHGDRLKVGRTEIKLSFERGKSEAVPEEEENTEEKKLVSQVNTNQDSTELSARNIARMARRKASMSWELAGAVSKLQQAKERLPRIETSGLVFVAGEPMATPPEYTMSPLPGTRWRQKWNCNAKTTEGEEAARRSQSPLLEQHGHPQSFHRPHARFVEGFDKPFTSIKQQPEVEKLSKNNLPPPLEYSSSPAVSPSSLAARQRYYLSQQPLVPVSGLIAKVPPPPISTGGWASSRRDDLRIQVSKKMAAAAPVGAGKANVPHVIPRALEFQAPASPVAQRDLLKQQISLQTILQHKFEEEKYLKQQQEEWMRHNMMSVSFNDNELLASTLQPLVESEKRLLDTDPNELGLLPGPTPLPLLGLRQHRILKPSPQVSAAIPASRARLNNFEERFNEPRCNDRKGRRKTTTLVLSPSNLHKWEVRNCNPAKEIELHSLDESVISTATTVITCHRRVTSSLSSSCTSSVDFCDFLGYEEEEDTEDMITSYTTPDLYGSAELLRT